YTTLVRSRGAWQPPEHALGVLQDVDSDGHRARARVIRLGALERDFRARGAPERVLHLEAHRAALIHLEVDVDPGLVAEVFGVPLAIAVLVPAVAVAEPGRRAHAVDAGLVTADAACLRLRREQEPADDPDADQHREGVRLDAAVVQVTKHGAGGGNDEAREAG